MRRTPDRLKPLPLARQGGSHVKVLHDVFQLLREILLHGVTASRMEDPNERRQFYRRLSALLRLGMPITRDRSHRAVSYGMSYAAFERWMKGEK